MCCAGVFVTFLSGCLSLLGLVLCFGFLVVTSPELCSFPQTRVPRTRPCQAIECTHANLSEPITTTVGGLFGKSFPYSLCWSGSDSCRPTCVFCSSIGLHEYPQICCVFSMFSVFFGVFCGFCFFPVGFPRFCQKIFRLCAGKPPES